MLTLEAVLARVGVLLIVLCWISTLLARENSGVRRARERLALPVSAGLLMAAIALRWWHAGQGPFFTLYEILLSNVFSLLLVFLVALRVSPVVRAGAPLVLGVLSLLGIWIVFQSPQVIPLPPGFDNPWLWVHVLSGKIFLGCLLMACGLAVDLMWGARAGRPVAPGEDDCVWRLMRMAFVFDSLMLLTGALWAQDAWGRFWSWDPLETSALVTWLLLALLLHARVALRLPERAQWSAVGALFVLAFLTFFGVPFLSMAPHKGFL